MSLLENGYCFGGFVCDILSGKLVTSETLLIDPLELRSTTAKRIGMKAALRMSMKGIGSSSPNPSVGCVVLNRGQLKASGFTQAFGGNHAERQAAKSHDFSDSDSDVFVTLEPCNHTGKTPPCLCTF